MNVKVLKIRIDNEFLKKDQSDLNDFLASHKILKTESAFAPSENCWSVIVYYETEHSLVKEPSHQKYSATSQELTSDEILILDALKLWRTEKAKEQKLPSYFIASNNELMSLAKYKPTKKEELLEIKGFGKHKVENYGEDIIELLENV